MYIRTLFYCTRKGSLAYTLCCSMTAPAFTQVLLQSYTSQNPQSYIGCCWSLQQTIGPSRRHPSIRRISRPCVTKCISVSCQLPLPH
ncbi:hypothetical protein V8C35DRAFT_289748 [Trichoderma chlorosporum]